MWRPILRPTQNVRPRSPNPESNGVTSGLNSPSTAVPVRLDVDGRKPLLDVLRNHLGLMGTRYGCGLEQCGSCMVLVDGEPAYACTREIGTVAGRTVTTIEGLGTPTASRIRCSRRSSTSRPASAATACPAS